MVTTDGDFDESFFEAPAGSHESDAAGSAPSTPVNAKRKRGPMNSPGTVNDEDEVARRRRRRQSLAFAQRRKSLTLTSSGGKQKTSDDTSAAPASVGGTVSRTTTFARTTSMATGSNNRQYISDMYSTIIKMSSENKINVKNSWSLHLIDHMEDILGSSRKEDEEDADDTYNFQKASCTLDASIKIYSYRVDDTWNSSYKILENLSRTDDKGSKQQGADSDGDDDADDAKVTRKAARKSHAAVRTIEKNLNNINLKSYELEFEADPLFHKMSQSFDEGGAKGMLLANLGVYDGCKILLNSSDVGVSTRKPLDAAATDVKTEKASVATVESAAIDANSTADTTASDVTIKTERSDPAKRINLSAFGPLACFTEDVLSFEVCPPLGRLYEQLDEYYGDEAPQLKVKTTSEHLIKTPVKPNRLSLNDPMTPVRARLDFDDFDDASQPTMDVIAEVDEDAAEAADMDVEMDDAEAAANDFEFGGDDGDDNEDATGDASQVDGSQLADGSSSQVAMSQTLETEFGDASPPDVLDVTANAADFFKSRAALNSAAGGSSGHDDTVAYTMMIENALLRSAASGNGDDGSGASDYSYFDVKMLRNWAGPAHWKFPAVRRVQAKTQQQLQVAEGSTVSDELALIEASDNEEDNGGDNAGAGKSAGAKARAAAAAAAKKSGVSDTKSHVIDFFAADEPDLKIAFKQPRAASAITMSKIIAKRQGEKAAELVFPVDSHVELSVFFQHFMKPKLRFFKRPLGHAAEQNDFVSSALDATYRDADAFAGADARGGNSDDEARGIGSGGDFSGGDFSGGDDYDYGGADDNDDDELYSTEGLITAGRVVEKIDVHYERFAKRVDVKKLKHNIWSHLEHETKLLGDSDAAAAEAARVAAEVDALSDTFEAQTSMTEPPTTFESVVQRVSDRVPPDVTVSFYFICMLHLANEKGLELQGQDDLRNFTIRKEATDAA